MSVTAKLLELAAKKPAKPAATAPAKQAAPKPAHSNRVPYTKTVKDKHVGDPVMAWYAPDKLWYPAYARRVNRKGATNGGLAFSKDTVVFAWAGPYESKTYETADAIDVVPMSLPRAGDPIYAADGRDWYAATCVSVEGSNVTLTYDDYPESGEFVQSFPYTVVLAARRGV